MNNKHLKFICSLFPFSCMDEKEVEAVFSEFGYTVSDYQKDSVIFSPSNYEKRLGFILKGECEVIRERCDGDYVPLNTLYPRDSFGILSFLSNESEYPTEIRAAKSSSVLFIESEDMLAIIKKYPQVAMNVISFLAKKVAFLNKKMATFSEKSTSQRLASYLLNKYKACGREFSASRTKISAEINIGRASLYRDLDAFEKEGLISMEQKKIIINCPEGLERKIK